MTRSKLILIACPQHRKHVRGSCPCDDSGRYRLAADGTFDLELVRCDQDGGRCAETLCALHRYNRRGPGTWYPSHVRAMPSGRRPRRARRLAASGAGDATFDQIL